MKITDIRPTTVTVPLEAPLRHANGCHWGRFVRTIVEVDTDEGITGLGEMGGGGESAEAVFRAMKSYLVGHDPARIEQMRYLIANPTASLYNNRTQILAALEFACLDILGKKWDVPVSEILGGRLQERVRFASYLFFRYPNSKDGSGEVRTVDQLVAHARELKDRYGFTSHKLKGGVFAPEYELECYRAIAAALDGVPRDAFTVLLAHSPDIADNTADYGFAVQLSGHTHGGHLRLPLIGPFARPRYGRRYVMGLYKVGAMTLYVSRGLGGVPLRLLCRPEATVLTLRRG